MKAIKKLVLFILLILIIMVIVILLNGYKVYSEAIEKTSIEDKVSSIRNDTNFTSINDVSMYYKNAVISVEDKRFYDHFGIDIFSLGRAIMNNFRAKELVEGGSTISQQVAKNLYFITEDSFSRKIPELFVTLDLEKKYSKDEIFELYMNTIYFGEGYYGIYEASQGYYKKDPAELNLYEASMLAGVPNAPSVYAPTVNMDLATKRQEKVLQTMLKNGYISQEEYDKTINYK